ncbi:hypothetical protein [Gynurincola endophyticus]|uniref:hypothetical protein n=1 Tax=Gynurincola endophyticus TaxID=2479004 RepID=UPI000F8DD7F8|nr:hypothetical protein [Gynurincola endophyticus]
MKKLTCLLLVITVGLNSSAQSLFSKFKTQKEVAEIEDSTELKRFHSGLQEVLLDFPYNFKHVKANLLEGWGDYEKFQSKIVLPNSIECYVENYNSGLDTSASWNAILLRTELKEEAQYLYKKINSRLRSCKIKVVDGSIYYLDGEFDEMTDEKDFVTSKYQFQTADRRFRNFYVNLELSYDVYEWRVSVYMGSKVADADMRPDWWQGNDD